MKKALIFLGIVLALASAHVISIASAACTPVTSTYPGSLDTFVANDCIPSSWANTLESTIGTTTATTSLQQRVAILASTTFSGGVGPSTSTYIAVFNSSGTVLGYAPFTYNSSTNVVSIGNELLLGSNNVLSDNSYAGLQYQDNGNDGNGQKTIYTVVAPSANPQEADLTLLRTNASGSLWWDFSNQCYGATSTLQQGCAVPYFDEIQGYNGSTTPETLRIGFYNQLFNVSTTEGQNSQMAEQISPTSSIAIGPFPESQTPTTTYALIVLSTSTINTGGPLALTSTSTAGTYDVTFDNSGDVNAAGSYQIGGANKLFTSSGNTVLRSSNGIGFAVNSASTFASASMVIATSGFVGIGTTAPSNPLTIVTTSTHSTVFIQASSTDGYLDANPANNAITVGSYTNSPLQFVVNNTNLVGYFDTSSANAFNLGGNVILQSVPGGGYLQFQSKGLGDNGEDSIFLVQAPSSSPQESTVTMIRTASSGAKEWMDIGSMNYNTTDTTALDGGLVHINYISNDIQGTSTQFMPFVMQFYDQASGTFQAFGKPYYIADPLGGTAIGMGYLYDEAGIHTHNYDPNLPLQVLGTSSDAFAFAVDTSTAGNAVQHTFTITPLGQASATSLCLGGVCNSTWPSSGAGSVTTSSAITANEFPYWANTTGALAGTSTIFYSTSTGDISVGTSTDNGIFSIATKATTTNAMTVDQYGNVAFGQSTPILENGGAISSTVSFANPSTNVQDSYVSFQNNANGKGEYFTIRASSTFANLRFQTGGTGALTSQWDLGNFGSKDFSILDDFNSTTPFTLKFNAPTNSLVINASGTTDFGYAVNVSGTAAFQATTTVYGTLQDAAGNRYVTSTPSINGASGPFNFSIATGTTPSIATSTSGGSSTVALTVPDGITFTTSTQTYTAVVNQTTTPLSCNGTTSSTIYSYSVPANSLGTTGAMYRVTAAGTYFSSSTQQAMTVFLDYGGSVVTTRATAAIATSTQTGNWMATFTLTNTAGTTNKQTGSFNLNLVSGGGSGVTQQWVGTTTVDSTQNQTLSIACLESGTTSTSTVNSVSTELVGATQTVVTGINYN